MKRLCTALLSVLLAFGMTACGAKALDDAALQKIAEETVAEFVAGEYAKVEARMSPASAKKLPAEALGNAWDTTTTQIGVFVEQTGSVVNPGKGGKSTVVVTCKYSVKELLVSLTFSKKGQIEGVWLSYGAVVEQPMESGETFEEHPIEIGHGATKLKGKLTLPKGVEKPPVVVMVQGSGAHDMDSTIGKAGNKPFRDLAHGLASKGIATIRFDKRYFTYPEEAQSVENGLTVEAEVVKDVSSALELAETDPRVDNSRVYLLGHSLGGMLAPKIAYDNPSIKGMVSLAGSLRGLEDIILDQNIEAMAAMGMTEEEQAKTLKTVQEEAQKVKELTKSKKASVIFGQPSSYWESLNNYRGEEYAKKLAIPMLILQGESDFQCSVEKDYQSWRNVLADKANVTYWVYGGLNHLFMPSSGVRDITDYNAPNHVEQKVIDDIATWVVAH